MSRSVVVSGGGTGIGRSIAQWFAKHGDNVLIVGRRQAVLEETARDIGVRWISADLRTAEGAEAVVDRLKSVDVIVTSAGGRATQPITSLKDVAEQYRAEYDVNVLTAVLLVEALLPVLRRPGGRIVGIGSISGHRGTADSYSTAKAALHGWIYWLARSLSPQGITANLVNPGYVEGTDFFGAPNTEEWYADASTAPVGRAGRPEEIASAVGYLASEDASFVTGQILGVNGGIVYGR